MALKKITYNGSSKVIINLCKMVNQLIDGASSPSASDVSYDNTGSGLSAENVQDAIDEVHGDIPTKTSQLTNDSGFITNTVNNLVNYYLKSETYTQAEVDALISAIATVRFEVVQTLPVSDIQTNVIYLVPSSDPGAQNIYDEYINTTGTSAGWELIGSTQVDLSDYVTTQDLNTALADYVTSADLTTVLADYVESADLATVATTGDYDDLTNKPTIPAAQVQSDWNQADNTQPDYIKNKPSIPSGGVTDVEVNGTSVVSGGVASVTVPTALSDLSEDSTHRTVTDTEKSTWSGKVSDNPTFTEASTRANIASGESFATILGKIKKWFSDLASMFVSKTGDTMSGNLTIDRANGTASSIGESFAILGNATAEGTAGNSRGRIRIYGSGVSRADIFDDGTLSGSKTFNFPNMSGTFALANQNNNFSANQTIDRHDGTTTATGTSTIILGNNIPEGTEGNSKGEIRIYGKGSYNAKLRADNITGDRAVSMPDKGGTIALTSDLPQDSGWIADSNYAYRKIGSVVLIEIGSLLTLSNGWTTIGTLPNGYHSTAREEYGLVIGELHTPGVFESLLLAVRTSGNVQIYSVGGISKTMFGSVTLMV